MTLLDTLVQELTGPKSTAELVKTSGATETQVNKLVTAAMPLFITGMMENAGSENGAQSLSAALSQHAPSAEKSTAAMLKKADLEDGKKIVSHVLGDNEKDVVRQLAKSTGLTQKKTNTLLSQMAPVVLALVGQNKEEEEAKPAQTNNLLGILSGALLGGGAQTTQQSSGLNLAALTGPLLGSLFGGQSSNENATASTSGAKPKDEEKPASGGLTSLLMGLLK